MDRLGVTTLPPSGVPPPTAAPTAPQSYDGSVNATQIQADASIPYPSSACYPDVGGATRCGVPVGYATVTNRTGAVLLPKVGGPCAWTGCLLTSRWAELLLGFEDLRSHGGNCSRRSGGVVWSRLLQSCLLQLAVQSPGSKLRFAPSRMALSVYRPSSITSWFRRSTLLPKPASTSCMPLRHFH